MNFIISYCLAAGVVGSILAIIPAALMRAVTRRYDLPLVWRIAGWEVVAALFLIPFIYGPSIIDWQLVGFGVIAAVFLIPYVIGWRCQ